MAAAVNRAISSRAGRLPPIMPYVSAAVNTCLSGCSSPSVHTAQRLLSQEPTVTGNNQKPRPKPTEDVKIKTKSKGHESKVTRSRVKRSTLLICYTLTR